MKVIELFEDEVTLEKLAWDSNPTIGWWRDADVLRLYHGTNSANLDSIAKSGLNRMDSRTGMISFAFEPFTARAFAVMGGEENFRAAGAKAKIVPENQRAVLVFDVPMSWILKHEDPDLRGNDDMHLRRLRSKSEYEKFDGNDQQYYQLCELRVDAAVPVDFLVGYMIK